MIIELSPIKIICGAITCWNQPGPDVDLVVDLKNLTFRDESIDEMYSFHVLDHLFEDEVIPALSNWRKCLKKNSNLFVVVDDFEYIARAFVGGDMAIGELNDNFAHPTNINHDNLLGYMKSAGFNEDNIIRWFGDVVNTKREVVYQKKHFELVFSSKNE